MYKNIITSSIILWITIFVWTLGAYANNNAENEKIIKKLEALDPYKLKTDKFSREVNSFFGFSKKEQSLTLNYNEWDRKISINKNWKIIQVWIPNSLQDTELNDVNGNIFASGNTADLIIQVIDGGVRQTLNIKSKDAKKSYDFSISMPESYTMQETASGGILILDDSQKLYSFLMAPWAKDANGKDIKTYYKLVWKGTIRQYIEFDDKSAFPVIADPTWCSSFISYTQWNYIGFYDQNYPWYLSVYPTSCGSASIFWWWGFAVNYSWDEVLWKTPVTAQWNKVYGTNQYWSMYYQYACHANFAASFKTPWNLEPNRPNVGYLATVNAICNP